MKIESANQISGLSTGATFMAIFGAVWFLFALTARGILNAKTIAEVAPGLLLLLLPAIYLFRMARRFPRVAEDANARHRFNRVNAAQWIAGFVLFYVLRWMHLDDYFLSGLTAIVGLHFFPLARIYRNPAAYGTGAILIAWAIASVAFVPVEHLPSTTGFGTGMVLWQSAATTLAVTLSAVHHSNLALRDC